MERPFQPVEHMGLPNHTSPSSSASTGLLVDGLVSLKKAMKERKLCIAVIAMLLISVLAWFKLADSGVLTSISGLAVAYMTSNVSLKGMGKEA